MPVTLQQETPNVFPAFRYQDVPAALAWLEKAFAFRKQMEVVERNQLFNTCLAKARIRNEHCIGILKNRWECLKEMRVWIKGAKEVQYIVDLVNACCVLHNMLADLGDSWLEMDVAPDEVEAIDRPLNEDNAFQADDAKAFREAVQAETLRIIYGDPML